MSEPTVGSTSSGESSGDALDFDSVPKGLPTVATHADLLAAFASSTEQARSYLVDLNGDRAAAEWRLVAGELYTRHHGKQLTKQP